MNIKKIVSAVTAFALSATMFAGFSIQANAADADVVYERGTITAWSDTDLSDWASTGVDASIDTTNGLGFNTKKPGSAYSAVKTFTFSENSIIEYDITWYTGNSTGRENNYEYLQIGSGLRIGYNSSYNFYASTDGGTTYDTTALKYDKSVAARNVVVKIDTAKNKILSLSLAGTDLAAYTDYTMPIGTTYDSVTIGLQRGGSTSNWDYPNYITKISVSETKQTVETAGYEIKYVIPASEETPETEIKKDNLIGVVNDAPVINMDDFKISEQRYICDSNDYTDQTIAADGSTVITVNCHAAETYTMKAVPSTDDSISFATSDVIEHDGFTYSYPKYLTDENNKIIATCDETAYIKTVIPTKSEVITVPYTAYTGNIYCVEAEDIFSNTIAVYEQLSGGKGERSIASGNVFTVPENGLYTITARVCNYNTNKETYIYLYKNSEADENLIRKSDNIDVSYKYIKDDSATNVALNANDTIYIKADSNTILDYVLIEKTGELPVITATTEKPVDITTAPTTTTADLINRETGAVQTAGAAVDLADVTTVYIKVDNVANKTVMPSIKVGTETYAPTYKYEINSNGYFVYQFVGIDLTGAIVSYDGAADVTL